MLMIMFADSAHISCEVELKTEVAMTRDIAIDLPRGHAMPMITVDMTSVKNIHTH